MLLLPATLVLHKVPNACGRRISPNSLIPLPEKTSWWGKRSTRLISKLDKLTHWRNP
jgi:hypothetical protein